MTARKSQAFARFVLIGACALAGCTNGRLDVLEPLSSGSGAGAPDAAGGSSGSAASPFVLDDFEDGDTRSLSIAEGYWYFQPDPTCTGSFGIELIGDRPGNTHAIRARGGGCSAWGALLGLDLGGGAADSFDSTSFDALRLWARAEPGTFTALNVSLLDPYHFDSVIDLLNDWQEFTLPLDDFSFNDDEGDDGRFDRQALTHLQFFVFSPEPFDFWVDDLAFVRSP